jgi:hypothetical protein
VKLHHQKAKEWTHANEVDPHPVSPLAHILGLIQAKNLAGKGRDIVHSADLFKRRVAPDDWEALGADDQARILAVVNCLAANLNRALRDAYGPKCNAVFNEPVAVPVEGSLKLYTVIGGVEGPDCLQQARTVPPGTPLVPTGNTETDYLVAPWVAANPGIQLVELLAARGDMFWARRTEYEAFTKAAAS